MNILRAPSKPCDRSFSASNLSRYAGQVAGLMGGYPGQTTQSFVPNPSPLQTAIGAGSALAGIFGALRG